MATSLVAKCEIAASFLREILAAAEAAEIGDAEPLTPSEVNAMVALDEAVQLYARDLLDAMDGGVDDGRVPPAF